MVQVMCIAKTGEVYTPVLYEDGRLVYIFSPESSDRSVVVKLIHQHRLVHQGIILCLGSDVTNSEPKEFKLYPDGTAEVIE